MERRTAGLVLLALGVASMVLAGVFGNPWPFLFMGPGFVGPLLALLGLGCLAAAWAVRPPTKTRGRRE